MHTILLTAFEPYGPWPTNASALALAELGADLSRLPNVAIRVLPVDYEFVKAQLAEELAANYDYVFHLGQAPDSDKIRLEAVALNIACPPNAVRDRPLCSEGPLAYRSSLPLDDLAEKIRAAGIPVEVSYHAGTYLCNAALYLTHYYIDRLELKTRAAFIHLPLDASQDVAPIHADTRWSTALSAAAIKIVLESLG
ncbi:MAG: pyroglutamyl-peptidase I [Pirellulales bacterium]